MSYIGASPTQTAFVTDQFSGNGSTTAFTMSVAPANTASVLVIVSGVVQDPSTYSVSGTTLTFTGAPPTGTGNISARYLGIPASGVTTTAYRTVTNFTATSGQTTFSPPSYTAGFINVYRNGVYLATTDYTATNGTTVVLNNGCTTGDTVTVESFLVSSVLNAIPNTNASVSNSNLAALATLPVSGGTITLPQVTGTAMISGAMPLFQAYLGTNQNPTNATYTKVNINTVVYDTASCFNTSTYRFTPNVAGYYLIQGAIRISSTTPSTYVWAIYKNGVDIAESNVASTPAVYDSRMISTIIQMNGSTDYVELYGYCSASSAQTFNAGSNTTWFSGYLIRNT